ncbi:MAG: hypothetical protein ACE5HS_08865 [bacterium]
MHEEEDSKDINSSERDSEGDFFHLSEDDEEENVSDELRYWQKYFEERDEELRFRNKKKIRKKGKFKDQDLD